MSREKIAEEAGRKIHSELRDAGVDSCTYSLAAIIELVMEAILQAREELKMSSEPSAETHVLIGTFRKAFADVMKDITSQCPICDRWWRHSYGDDRAAVMLCWQMGHIDTPVYKTIEEVIRLQKPPEVVKPPPESISRPRNTMWPEN